MLNEMQIEQYFEDGYVIPDYRIPEETIIAIQDRHTEYFNCQYALARRNNMILMPI